MVTLHLCRSSEARQPYYVTIRSVGNGKTLFWTENYTTVQNARNAGQILINNGLRARWAA